jgi:hypothetical protein
VVVHVVTTSEAATPGFVLGGGVLPAPMIAELARTAKVKPVILPGDAVAEPRYRASAGLEWFIRLRDLTCRFPGCEKPADLCDIDHTVPFDIGGVTHPSNLKCLCRKHHLHKPLTAGEIRAGEISSPKRHRYGDATAKRRHSPGTPLSS